MFVCGKAKVPWRLSSQSRDFRKLPLLLLLLLLLPLLPLLFLLQLLWDGVRSFVITAVEEGQGGGSDQVWEAPEAGG